MLVSVLGPRSIDVAGADVVDWRVKAIFGQTKKEGALEPTAQSKRKQRLTQEFITPKLWRKHSGSALQKPFGIR